MSGKITGTLTSARIWICEGCGLATLAHSQGQARTRIAKYCAAYHPKNTCSHRHPSLAKPRLSKK